MELRDIMTRDVEVVSAGASLKEATSKMKSLDVGLLPVCDGDRLQGILTDSRYYQTRNCRRARSEKNKVAAVMSTDLAYCLEKQEVEEAVSLMEARKMSAS